MRRWAAWRQRLWSVLGGVSIRTKILGIVLALVVLLGLVVVVQVRAMLLRVMQGQLELQGRSVAEHVAAHSADPVLGDDLDALSRALQDTKAHTPDVRYIVVLDPAGRVLAHTFDGEVLAELRSAHPLPPGSPYRQQTLLTLEGRVWDTAVPISDGRAGVVRVGLSEQRLVRTINRVIFQIILTILFFSLLGILAAFVLTWLLTNPILNLVAATQRVGRGDYSARVKRWAEDEIGDLTEAFNAMVEQLAQAGAERAERDRLRQFYLQRVIHAQEEERRRIARELHDETGQALASLMVGLRNVEEAPTPEETGRRLHDLRQVVAATLERVRRLAFELRPSALDDLGLLVALRRYAQEYRERFGIAAEVQALGVDPQGAFGSGRRLAPEVETTIYRIVQEAMTNAAKYAAPARVSVLLQARDGQLSVIVEDDGRGFDVQQVFAVQAGQSKLGLYGMQERAELVGGRLDIESQPGAGTTVYLRVPVGE
jgi:signal transduction histidine kinase